MVNQEPPLGDNNRVVSENGPREKNWLVAVTFEYELLLVF